jgi:hypothetical protein
MDRKLDRWIFVDDNFCVEEMRNLPSPHFSSLGQMEKKHYLFSSFLSEEWLHSPSSSSSLLLLLFLLIAEAYDLCFGNAIWPFHLFEKGGARAPLSYIIIIIYYLFFLLLTF